MSDTSPDAWIPLPDINAALRALTDQGGPGYRRLHMLAMDGAITPPLEKQRGRWGCHRSKLPALAMALGLVVKPPAAPAKQTRIRRSAERLPVQRVAA